LFERGVTSAFISKLRKHAKGFVEQDGLHFKIIIINIKERSNNGRSKQGCGCR
jgi:hypothetical protein